MNRFCVRLCLLFPLLLTAAGPARAQAPSVRDTTVGKLCQLNGITEKTILHIGRKLRVK